MKRETIIISADDLLAEIDPQSEGQVIGVEFIPEQYSVKIHIIGDGMKTSKTGQCVHTRYERVKL